jgi:putative transposase
VCDLIRQIRTGYENSIVSGKVACERIHVLVACRPRVDVSRTVQWLKGLSSVLLLQESAHLQRSWQERHPWARGCLAVSTENLGDGLVLSHINKRIYI